MQLQEMQAAHNSLGKYMTQSNGMFLSGQHTMVEEKNSAKAKLKISNSNA